jgi:putative hydrolase of the HAD superfamily
MESKGQIRYRALLIDFDGVLRRWPASNAAIEQPFGLPAGALHATAFAPELLQAAVTGRITDEAWRGEVAARLARQYPDARSSEAVQAWSSSAGEVDVAVLRLVERAAARLKTVLVTNGTTRLARDLSILGLDEHLHVVVNSAAVGAAKPDAAFFRAALKAADVEAAEALFVDDTPAHVAAAMRAGIRSLRFEGHEGLAAFLRASNVLSMALALPPDPPGP